MKTHEKQKIDLLPPYILEELHIFLTDESNYLQLEEALKKTGLVLEKDNFQIPINTKEDLINLLAHLNIKYS